MAVHAIAIVKPRPTPDGPNRRHLRHGVTVNTAELDAVPPAVVTAILPVLAPLGTTAVTCVFEIIVTLVAFTPPKVTLGCLEQAVSRDDD